MKKTTIFLFISLLLFSCKKAKVNIQNANTKNTKVFYLKTQNNDILNNLIDSISFMEIKEDNDSYFNTIDKLVVNENNIYILDRFGSKSLFQFNLNGDFIRKIGNKGMGPGEYVNLCDFDIDSKSIYLCDRAKKKILQYNLNGDFIKQTTLQFRVDGIKALANEKYLLSVLKDQNNHKIFLTDKYFNVEKKYFYYESKDNDNKGSDNIFQDVNNFILYNKATNDTIFAFSKNGQLIENYYFDFGSNKVPEDLRYDHEKLAVERTKRNIIYFYNTPMIVKDILIGQIFFDGCKATLLYDMKKKEYSITQLKPHEVSYNNLLFPLFANQKFIISWLDYSIYEILKNKPLLNEKTLKSLKDGKRVLCFYHLKNEKK